MRGGRTVGPHLGRLVVAVQVAGVKQHRSHREVERPPLLPHLCAGRAFAPRENVVQQKNFIKQNT